MKTDKSSLLNGRKKRTARKLEIILWPFSPLCMPRDSMFLCNYAALFFAWFIAVSDSNLMEFSSSFWNKENDLFNFIEAAMNCILQLHLPGIFREIWAIYFAFSIFLRATFIKKLFRSVCFVSFSLFLFKCQALKKLFLHKYIPRKFHKISTSSAFDSFFLSFLFSCYIPEPFLNVWRLKNVGNFSYLHFVLHEPTE